MENNIRELIVFIPAYNAAKTIVSTLDAVNASAKHSELVIDVCVCDDRSTDNTVNVVKDYRASNIKLNIYINDVNVGERGTINKIWKELGNEYKWVLLIHADDLPKEYWIDALSREIATCNPDNIFTIWSSFDAFNDKGGTRHLGDDSGGIIYNQRKRQDASFYIAKVTSSFHVSGAAFNLQLFSKIGGFDETMPQYGDTDFFARGILSGFNDIYIKRTLTRYRVIASSVSFVSKRSSRDIKEMFYMINKYSDLLSKQQKRQIFKLAISYSGKRFLKSLLGLQLLLLLQNLILLQKSTIGLIYNMF